MEAEHQEVSMNALFIVAVVMVLAVLLQWGVRALPREEWQMLAALPARRRQPGEWSGVNVTMYGVLSATATVLAVTIFLILMASVGVPVAGSALVAALVLGLGVPSAKLLARLIEGTRHGHSIAGATLVGLLTAPVASWIAGVPLAPTLGALAVAYVLGESVGRLACLSFGCCFGRPIADLDQAGQRLLGRFSLAFHGATKKIAYVADLEGVRVMPVQAVAAVVLATLCAVGTTLFAGGRPLLAFLVLVGTSQGWRAWSETWRGDHLRAGRSPYQLVAVAVVVIAAALAAVCPSPGSTIAPDLFAGAAALWDPAVLVALQILWLVMFRLTGWSEVTESTVSFHVRQDRT
jgi:hypothetical protein